MSLKVLSYFQGKAQIWEANDQSLMGSIIPEDRDGFSSERCYRNLGR